MVTDTDEALVARVRMGDARAFALIHARYRRRLLEFACRRLGARREEAEDVLQDVFIRAYHGLLGSDREVDLRPWLFRITANRVIDELRRPRHFVPSDFSEQPERHCPAPGPLAVAAAREELADVLADLVDLPRRQRQALVSQAVSGIPHELLAQHLGTTVPGSKALVNRARVTLHHARSDRLRLMDAA
jgi:RNA polymerase sigma factor (sigma-70 family)